MDKKSLFYLSFFIFYENDIYNEYSIITIKLYIIIPLDFIPVFKFNETNSSHIMRNVVYTKAYSNIEIGMPKQMIQIPLDFESNDFYISENAENVFLKL